MSDSQENAENCRLRAFEKNNYFYGKLMTVRDFVLEQQYVNDKRWLINNLLFGSGTVCGLNVSTVDMSLVVKSGFAIDKCGREIILPENVSITLADKDTPDPGKKKAIYISYKECPKERVRAQTASTCDEVCANNRIEESYDFEIRDVADVSDPAKERLCKIWNNLITEDIEVNYGNDRFRFKRRTKRYVSEGDLFEIYLELTNMNNANYSSIPEITDTLPAGLTLVEGSNKIGGTIPSGETFNKWYVVKVDANPPSKFILIAKIIDTPINSESPESTIEVKTPHEISEKLFADLYDFWTQPCLEENIDQAVKIAEFSLENQKIIVDNTKRKLVNNNKYMTKMLECLHLQASALEDQTTGIKNKLAPSNITLSAKPTQIDADGVEFSTITVSVKNGAGVGLPDIDVNLISTLGNINNYVKTGPDGLVTAILKSETISGNAAIMATTGIGTAVTQVEFRSINGIIEGYVKVEGTDTVIKGATVSVGTITAMTREEDGKFILENVPPGKQVVWAFADKFDEGSCRVVVTAKDTTTTTIFLTPISTIGAITGSVLDIDGNAIGNVVKVTAGGVTATANEAGNYTLSNVPAGTHTVTASAEGYQTQNRSSVVVKADSTTSGIDFRLERATGTIKGVVTASLGIQRPEKLLERGSAIDLPELLSDIGLPIKSKGIPDAKVSLVGTTLSAMTDEFGNYIIRNVPLGAQAVTAKHPDYNASTSSVFVEANQTIPVNFQLTKLVTTGTVTGKVTTLRKRSVKTCIGGVPAIAAIDSGMIKAVDMTIARPDSTMVRPTVAAIERPKETTIVKPIDATIARSIDTTIFEPVKRCVSGEPSSLIGTMEEVAIEGAIVRVAGKSVVTDANGNYTIPNVPSGSQEVSAEATGYVKQISTVTVEAGGTATADFQLVIAVSTGTISGRVTRYSLVPIKIIPFIKGAKVSVAETNLSAITDELGNYTISNVPTGTYTVNADATGYNTGTKGAKVNENLTTTVNFELEPLPTTGNITGKVTDMNTIPIVSAGVRLIEVGDSVITDAKGNYRFSNVQPGSNRIDVNATGYNYSTRTVNVIAGQTTSADFMLTKIICQAGKPDIDCMAGKPNTSCTAGQPDIDCMAGKPNTSCTAGQPDIDCMAGKPDAGCPAGKPENICIMGEPGKPCPAAKPETGDRFKMKSNIPCPAGRPSISPKNTTRPQIKPKGGRKK